MELHLIPEVKKCDLFQGFLKNKSICPLGDVADSRLMGALGKLPQSQAGTPVSIKVTGTSGEGYSLFVREDAIEIQGDSPAGAFYAIQTLRQLMQQDKVPCLQIRDEPDFSHRGFYQDVTRGRIPRVQTIKNLIDQMAYYKLNSLQLYVEHVFPFSETQDIISQTGCLTQQELKEIGEYCRENFIEFIPSLSTFGHLYDLLQQPQYRHLRVLNDYKEEPNFWHARMAHHTIDPLQQESFELVKSLIDQYMPCFESSWFNVCCDETFDLKRYAREGLDEGQIYVDFVKKILSYVSGKGKKVMMWADILLEHPEVIPQLPEDAVYLNWYYHPNPEQIREKITRFAETGKQQIVCPGTWSWHRLCENVAAEEVNICHTIRQGYDHGAVGVLNTNWGDWGNPCSLELGMYGMVLGAGKSWSVDTQPGEPLYRAVDALLYGSREGMAALTELSAIHEPIRWQSYVASLYEGKTDYPSRETVQEVQNRYLALEEKLRENWDRDEFRQELRLAAMGVCVMAEQMGALAGYELQRVTDTEAFLSLYRKKWLEKNKESELRNIETLFRSQENRIFNS